MQLKIILFATERIIGKDETESQYKVGLREKIIPRIESSDNYCLYIFLIILGLLLSSLTLKSIYHI